MDDIGTFTKKVEAEFEGMTPGTLKPDMNYRDLPEWSSMHALILVALSETEYNVTLATNDLKSCNTIRDLYNIIKSRV